MVSPINGEAGKVAVAAAVTKYPFPEAAAKLIASSVQGMGSPIGGCQEGGAPVFAVRTYPGVAEFANQLGTPLA
jgi:hypothetical protein